MFDAKEAVRKLVLNAARVSGVTPLAGRLLGGVGVVLMLHRVTRAAPRMLGLNAHLAVTPDFLDAVIAQMKRLGYRFVSMDEAASLIGTGGDGRPFAAITADDGYRDNLVEALPVLEAHAAPMAIHVAPGLVDGTADLWWEVLERVVEARDRVAIPGGEVLDCGTVPEKRGAFRHLQAWLTGTVDERALVAALRALAADAGIDAQVPSREGLMGWDEIARIARHPLVTIGAHTISHVNLRRLSEEDARAEMSGAADILAERLGKRPKHMAYPYGFERAVGPREVRLAAECGFETAVTTRHGLIQGGHRDHLQALPRLSVNGRFQDVGYVTTMLSGITTPLANRGKRLVTV